MTLTSEWQRRLDHWRRELPKHFYLPLDAIALAGFVTAMPSTRGTGKRTAIRCTLTTTLPVVSAAQTDMLEQFERELPCEADRIRLEFRSFETKTVRLRCCGAPPRVL